MSSEPYRSLDLSGKVIAVTGAGGGIGSATSRILADRGASVVMADVSADGEHFAEDLRRQGGKAAYIRTDVSDEDDVKAMIAFAVSQFGGLHGAFNNAGVNTCGESLHEMALESWQRVIAINQTGVFLCMKHQIAHMLGNGGGVIVNTSSGSGVVGTINTADYVASKHGVVGLTRSAALDYSARGIRVNAILPGAIETPMLRSALDRDSVLRAAVEGGHPIGHLGVPIDIAEAAAWLLSDAAAFVTGALFAIDGGYTAQ